MVVMPIHGLITISLSLGMIFVVVPFELLVSGALLLTGVLMVLSPVMYAVGLLTRMGVTLIEMCQALVSDSRTAGGLGGEGLQVASHAPYYGEGLGKARTEPSDGHTYADAKFVPDKQSPKSVVFFAPADKNEASDADVPTAVEIASTHP
jgi:hypothetical protein